MVTRDQPGCLREEGGTAHRTSSAQPGVARIGIGLELWPWKISYYCLVHRGYSADRGYQINADQKPLNPSFGRLLSLTAPRAQVFSTPCAILLRLVVTPL